MKSNKLIICILFFMLTYLQEHKAVEFAELPSRTVQMKVSNLKMHQEIYCSKFWMREKEVP
jgi:hypothetical protein